MPPNTKIRLSSYLFHSSIFGRGGFPARVLKAKILYQSYDEPDMNEPEMTQLHIYPGEYIIVLINIPC